MATKGDRASLEPICKRLYAQQWTLTAISNRFEVSVTTLSKWKKDTLKPGDELDEWEKAKHANVARGDNLRRLAQEQEEFVLGLRPEERDARVHDALAKAQANFRRFEEYERQAAQAMLDEAESGNQIDIDRPAIFLETMEWMARKLQGTDPEGLKVLARNFDYLILQFKTEYAKENQ